MALFRALRQRAFALLWVGQTISRLGDSLYSIALAWWVLEKTGSATAMGSVFIVALVPQLVFLLLGGVAVDRLPRVHVMLSSDVLSGAVVALVALLALTDHLQLWHVYVASAVFGFVSAFFEPAYAAVIPDLLPPELLPSANSLTSLSGRFVGIVGPPLGALFVKFGGSGVAFALDAASFLLSGVLIVPLLRHSLPAHSTEGQAGLGGIVRDVRIGIAAVFGSPWLWITIALFSLVCVTYGGPMAVALPFLIKESLGADVDALGLIGGAGALGAVMMAVALGNTTKLRRRGVLAYGAIIVGGCMVALMGLPIGLPGIVAASFVNGAMLAVFGLIWINTLQELVPRDLLGRVNSVDQLGSFALLPVGYAVAGWATERFGPQQVFVLGGSLTALLMIMGLLHPAIRWLD